MCGNSGKVSSKLRRVLSSVLAGVGFVSSSFNSGCYAAKKDVGKDSDRYSEIFHKIKGNKILTTVGIGSLIGAGVIAKKTFFGSDDVYDVSKSIIKKCLRSNKKLSAGDWYDKLVDKGKCVEDYSDYVDWVKFSYKKIDKESLEQIDKDLIRSMVPEDYREFLRDILVAYCIRDKHSYLQGFNDIASFVIRKFIGVKLADESGGRFGKYRKILSAQERLRVYCVFEAIMGIYRKYLICDEKGFIDTGFIVKTSRLICNKFIRDNRLQSFFGDFDDDDFVSIYVQINFLRFLSSNSQITFWDYLVSTIPENGKFNVDQAFKEIFNLFLALSFRANELNLEVPVSEIPIFNSMRFVSQGNEKELKLDEIS